MDNLTHKRSVVKEQKKRIDELEASVSFWKGIAEMPEDDKWNVDRQILQSENEILKMENSHSKLVVDEAKREIDRLKWLINRTWTDDLVLEFVSNVVLGRTDGKLLGEYMKNFKANNNL